MKKAEAETEKARIELEGRKLDVGEKWVKSHRGEKSQQVFALKIILFHIFIKKIMVFSRLPCLEFTSCFNSLNRN